MWRSALVSGVLAVVVLAQGAPVGVEAVAGGADTELRALEARVATHPADALALARLAERHAAAGVPGLAHAAYSRAPPAAARSPRALHALASVHLAAGDVRAAHEAERDAVAACERSPCGLELSARARLRAVWLASAAGVEPPGGGGVGEFRLARLDLEGRGRAAHGAWEDRVVP